MIKSLSLTSSAWSAPSPPGGPWPPRPKEPSLGTRGFWVLVFRGGSGLPVSQRLGLPWTPELCCWRMLWACSSRPEWGAWQRESTQTKRDAKQKGESLFYGKRQWVQRRETHGVSLVFLFLRGTATEVCDIKGWQTLYSSLQRFSRQPSSCPRQVGCGLVAA